MIQIRRNIFETNSSSVHSVVILGKSDYDKFTASDTFIHVGCSDNNLYSREYVENAVRDYVKTHPKQTWITNLYDKYVNESLPDNKDRLFAKLAANISYICYDFGYIDIETASNEEYTAVSVYYDDDAICV